MRLVSRRAAGAVTLAALILSACAYTPAPPIREVRVVARDSTHFAKQADGSWIEFSHAGLARFRFMHERSEGHVEIVLDETRNVRLRIDPHDRTITEDGAQGWRPLYTISEVVRAYSEPLALDPDAPARSVRRVWFEGGGAALRDGDYWVEAAKEDGMPAPHRWREIIARRDADTFVLHDEARHADARFELSERVVYFHDAGAPEPRLAVPIRAVDY